MYFQRYYLKCLSHASYMIADEKTKVAAVVDPQRDIDIYVKVAEARGFTIKHVIMTHFHADFISGHIELRDKLGARIYFGAKAEAEFDFHPLKDGEVIALGDVKLKSLETPGHTPEGISILVYEGEANADKPYAVLTGDTLFLGDVGRPDLLASIGVTGDELANMLYDSLHEKLLKLPDETLVYPAHGAGSMCGKQLSDAEVSTLGEQRRVNYALQPMPRERFVAMVTADQPEAPDYFVHDAILNRKDRQSLDEQMSKELKPLTAQELLDLQDKGAQLVDTREAVEFAGAHVRGSINIGIDGKYATWAGTVLNHDEPIVVIADSDRVEESVMRLGRIGFDNVAGYLKDGMDAMTEHDDAVTHSQRVTVSEADGYIERGAVLDVRTESERGAGHIEGSLHVPLNQLAKRMGELPATGPLIVHCQGGYRSSIALSMLERAGRDEVYDLVGGYAAWDATRNGGTASGNCAAGSSTCSITPKP